MSSRDQALLVLFALAVATVYMGLASAPSAQPGCPPGTSLCRTDTGYIFCGDCGVPDSNNIDSLRLHRMMVVIPEGKPTSGYSSRIAAPLSHDALEGATLEALVQSGGGPLAGVRMLRQQIQNQWKWTLSGNLGERAPKTTFQVMSAGRKVGGSMSGSTVVAEFAVFPSRLAVSTTTSATTVTWGFPGAIDMRLGAAPGKVGPAQHGDALAITFAKGSPNGFSQIALNRKGTGAINLDNVKTTLIPAAMEAAPASR